MAPPSPDLVRHLTELRRHIEDLLDSDHLLPADGHALLSMLRQTLDRIGADDPLRAYGLLLGFEILLQALLGAGILDPVADDSCIGAIRAVTASLTLFAGC